MRKKVAVLGSTGSIGKNTLRVIKALGSDYLVSGLSANRNLALFKKQIELWKPAAAAVQDEKVYKKLKKEINTRATKLLAGVEGVSEIASMTEADIVICAIPGSAALLPLLAAVRAEKIIGLASKEPVVMTGRLLMEEAEKNGAEIIPVDSEPNAIFQCLKNSGSRAEIKNLIITASGGPFIKFSRRKLEGATPAQALAHPSWSMGSKISVDSAGMINKGLEVIEAHNLFGIPYESIKVLIHPEAKIHSMVEFVDGNIMAVMSRTDMRIPIQYAVTYPERTAGPLKPLDLVQTGKLTFKAPDPKKFPGLGCCYEAGREGGTMPAVLNAANEIAVENFLRKKIKFTSIPVVCSETMKSFKCEEISSVERVMEIDEKARKAAVEIVKKLS